MDLKTRWRFLVLLGLCLIAGSNTQEAANEEDETLESSEGTTAEPTPLNEFEVISFDQGSVKGFLEYSTEGKPFYSFLGIPYAKPPTGSRRFKDPDYLGKWEAQVDGTVPPPPCTQIDINGFIHSPDSATIGEEDCLYLNIYTSDPHSKKSDLPVLVYIHGGHFVSGSASDYEPYDLLNGPLILVVLQYRLGVLGFMSTEDLVMPGNLGLKDQTMALKWIHANIENFGGSPLKITLFGSGSGAASVHYQTLTHHTIGLFSRGILQSGTALCPWASGGVHKEAAYHIGKHFKCLPDDEETKTEEGSGEEEDKEETGSEEAEIEVEAEGETKEEKSEPEELETKAENSEDGESEQNENVKQEKGEDAKEEVKEEIEKEGDKEDNSEDEELKHENLLQCLQEVEPEKLAKAVELFYMWSFLPAIMGPRTDGRYFPETPEFLLKHGRHKRLELIVGINKDDGSDFTNSLFLSEGRRMALKHHFPLIGPISLEFSNDDVAPLNMSIMAYDKYSGGLNVDTTDAHNLTKLFTDRHFGICSDLAADLQATNNERKKKNVYFYEFNHRGQRSTGDAYGLNFGKEWVAHGDELFYMFPMNKTKDFVRDEDDKKVRDYMTIMWYFFAETGNPTPNGTFDFTWEPYTKENRQHLKITTSPVMEEDSRKDVREFWSTLPTRQNMFMTPDYFTKLLNKTDTSEGTEEEKRSEGQTKENNEQRIREEL